MRRTTLGLQLLSALTLVAPAPQLLRAQDAPAASASTERWSAEELDNLLAPIALYPDPILAQVLVAATYPDQVLAAQAHVRAFGTSNIDEMPWEISVKAVARYEPVLNLLAEGEDWMTALGQAYASQAVDVMDAVQRLRVMANAQGNLQTTAQQQVVVEREVIRIVPAEPQVIYVPTYDPAVIYHRPVYIAQAHPAYWSWGVAYPVGVWLTYDVDWWGHRVYYHGWHSHGPSWVVVARPWIVINPWYVSPRHTVIVVNRGVAYRRWDTNRVRRYSTIHRNVGYERHDRGYSRDAGRYGSSSRDAGRSVSSNSRVTRGDDKRVTPLRGASSRDRSGTREAVARSTTREQPARDTRSAGGETTRSSNGTWNPRPSRTPEARSSSPARTSTPRASTGAGGTRESVASPRPGNGSAPRASAPRTNSGAAPRASAPRTSGSSEPRASAPRSSGSSAPRASAPRSSGSSAPRASAPRSSGGSAPRASAPRSGGSSGSSARGSSGRGRGN